MNEISLITLEGINIDIDKPEDKEKKARRLTDYAFRLIREESGMSRKEFSEWLNIPYRTMQEWELGRSSMPPYVLELIEYKVRNEKKEGRI